jgi:membrane protein DedA with SNARE-associated domain
MSAQLPGILQSLAPVFDRYGYVALTALIGVEGFGFPAPGQLILVAAGVYAKTGQLNLVAVLALGLLAAVSGDNIGYAIGRYGGRPLVRRFGRYVLLTEGQLAAAERFFAKRGNIVVPVARFVDGLRQANGIVAGLAQMRWWRFLAYNILGATAWVGLWVLVGYLAGDHIAAVYTGFRRYQKYLLAGLAAIVVAVIIQWVVRHRRESAARST